MDKNLLVWLIDPSFSLGAVCLEFTAPSIDTQEAGYPFMISPTISFVSIRKMGGHVVGGACIARTTNHINLFLDEF